MHIFRGGGGGILCLLSHVRRSRSSATFAFLLDNGANINAEDDEPLIMASERGQYNVAIQ